MECTVSTLILVVTGATILSVGQAQVTMLESPTSMVLEKNDEAMLSCRMDTAPDRFQWRHYPVGPSETYSSKYHLVLAEAHFYNVSPHMYKSDNSSTYLTIANTNISVAGYYQCLAHYGVQVIASKPGRISIPTISEIPEQRNITVTVTEGNTVQWSCPEPISNPPAVMNYFNLKKKMIVPKFQQSSLILPNVTVDSKNVFSCSAYNQFSYVEGRSVLDLNVVKGGRSERNEKPKFIVKPKQKYTVLKDSKVFLECAAVGEPVPSVRWSKLDGHISKKRAREETGGLYITNVAYSDQGTYVCEYSNRLGSVSVNIELEYNEKPKVVRGPFNKDTTTTIIEEGQDLELECEVTGVPKPVVSWFLNGETVKNDSNTRVEGNVLRFAVMQKNHAGMVQCFASNIASIDYGNLLMPVFPKQISGVQEHPSVTPNHKKRKHNKITRGRKLHSAHMIPPSKPNVTRLNDESVVVRWKVPSSDGSLPVKLFKVQYRDISRENDASSTWLTANTDIAPHITSFDVTSLKPDHTYRFRIAAVYSNDDNKPSPKSDAFHLKRLDFETRNPLPIPTITATETINATTIKVYWEYTPVPNITINGFFVNYMPATISGDYTKTTVDGEQTRSYVISHLDPNTIYEIRMQTFNSKHASDLSQKMHQRTTALVVETTTTPHAKKSEQEQAASANLYVIIIGAVVGVALLLAALIVIIVGRNWKKKKTANRNGNNGKQPNEDLNHHIQVESNEYVMPHKNPRTNGCVISPNHITIRSNPLADVDNKNQNMIEMSCLSSQNNNCSTTQASASTQEIHHADKSAAKTKKQKKNDNPENYV